MHFFHNTVLQTCSKGVLTMFFGYETKTENTRTAAYCAEAAFMRAECADACAHNTFISDTAVAVSVFVFVLIAAVCTAVACGLIYVADGFVIILAVTGLIIIREKQNKQGRKSAPRKNFIY